VTACGQVCHRAGFALSGSKRCKGDELPCNGPSCLCGIFFFFFFCWLGALETEISTNPEVAEL